MKTKKKKTKNMMSAYFLAGILCLSFAFLSCTGQKTDVVQQAYELRLDGYADSAIVVLDNIILEDPENASAYYERARARKHIMKGTGQYGITDILADAEKACELDPGNVIYAHFCANAKFLDVYIDLMQGQEEVEAKLDDAILEFERTLELKPCFAPSVITLIEIYTWLGDESEVDYAKAEHYAGLLKQCDPITGLMAQAMLLPDVKSFLEFWLNEYESHEANAIIAENLGRAYLLEGDMVNGKKYIKEAVSLNPDNSIILLDLARASLMSAMQTQDKDLGEESIEAFRQTLELNPDAPGPIKAYVYGMMALCYGRLLEDQELADEYMAKKEALDPFCSRASGAPGMALFAPPDVLVDDIGYYSRPF